MSRWDWAAARLLRLFPGLAVVLALVAAFYYYDPLDRRGQRIVSTPREIIPRGDLASFEQATIAIFNAAAPSVVYIFTENAVTGFFGQRLQVFPEAMRQATREMIAQLEQMQKQYKQKEDSRIIVPGQ